MTSSYSTSSGISRSARRGLALHPLASAVLVLLACQAQAQTAPAAAPSAPTARLSEVTVTGNPLGSETVVAPAAQLSGDDLTLRTGPPWAKRWTACRA